MQFVVFEKIYECLFIPNCMRKIIWLPVNNIHEKISPCWLMKKFWDGWAEGTHAYHAIREKLRHKLRHPGRALDLKTKVWLAICEFLWSLTNQNAWFVSSFCTELTFFCTVFKQTAPLFTNQKEEIFSYALLVLKFGLICLYRKGPIFI